MKNCNPPPIPQEIQKLISNLLFSLVDKCVILDILDNDFAVSSDTQKLFDFLNFVSFRNEKEG